MSPEEPLVIGRTGEMDRLHNPYTPLCSTPTCACSCSPSTHPKTLQTLRHSEMDGTARSIDGGSPTRTSIYHALPQAPLLHIHPVCDLFFYVVEFSNLQKIGILETLPYNLHAWILFAAWFRTDEIL